MFVRPRGVPTDETSSPAPSNEAAQLPGGLGSASAPRPDALSAQENGSGDGDNATRKADGQTTSQPPAGQQDDWKAKLTAEQRAELLRDADPDEFARVNDRFNGYVGKRLQVEKASEADAAQARAVHEAREQALRSRDPDKALEALEGMTAAERKNAGDAAFGQSIRIHEAMLANPLTREFAAKFNGKNYGELAGGDGVVASILHRADLASVIEQLPQLETRMREKLEKELTPIIEKRVRARLNGEELPEDRGSGAAAPGVKRFTRADIARMTPDEYTRLEPEIMRQLGNRRAAATR